MKTKCPLVLVEWEDATELDETPWTTDDNDYVPRLVYQVGYLLSRTDKYIRITSAMTDGHVGRRDQIPSGMVRSIRILKVGKEHEQSRLPETQA